MFCFQRMKGVSLTRPGSRGAVLLRSGDERRCALFAASARNETPPSGRAATGLAAPSLGEWAADVRLEPSSGSPSRDDRDFFAHLEMHVRQERLAPTGRDHASYRSSYAPAKDVADGDLCAEFLALPADARRRVAADLDRTPADVAKKLEDARNRVL